MRRKELIEGIYELHNALVQLAIPEILMAQLQGNAKDNDGLSPVFLKQVTEYVLRAQKFSPAARQVAGILGISALENTDMWHAFRVSRDEAIELYNAVRYAAKDLPRLAALLQQGTAEPIEESINNKTGKYKGMRLLSVTVFEQGNRFSTPTRLTNVLESINLFYTTCAYLNDESPDSLSVVACDSGSDKSFDFLGIAKVVECVTNLIETLWDRIVFYRELQHEQRIELVAKTLPVIEQINNSASNGHIEPELAEQLKRNVLEGTMKFVQSGAAIPQIESRAHHDARSLLSPVQKLLISAPDEDAEENIEPSSDEVPEDKSQSVKSHSQMNVDVLSKDEREQLLHLLNKTKQEEGAVSTGSLEIIEEF
ncbi:MAG: hypothetical protein WKF74_02650 [Pyrinomonadaceae bacterium]